jgi:hypothetical protein
MINGPDDGNPGIAGSLCESKRKGHPGDDPNFASLRSILLHSSMLCGVSALWPSRRQGGVKQVGFGTLV